MTGVHGCPADGCGEQVPFDELACPRHFKMLPRQAQRLLARAQRYGNRTEKLAAEADAVRQINCAVTNRARQLADRQEAATAIDTLQGLDRDGFRGIFGATS